MIISNSLRFKDGAVVKALAFHRCDLSSIPGQSVICGLSLLVLYTTETAVIWVKKDLFQEIWLSEQFMY